ncbi:gamma-glutamylaminecyclotransferase-like isoform X2 [Ostrea edulis]|uniref:gamma-glutamylaminecyclotransferase-like isoform X2 n=1 Tax=Ostrea edulis TaxID=37623 RepID=UPI0024AF863C|nr:gamma-glutamylaminecyclotransferase-like isoform X2 [Ostrea edulis]
MMINIDQENTIFMNKVFVYGTLKNGQPNFFRLMDPDSGSATFVNEGRTVDKYPLVIERSWNLPCLLNEPGTGMNVKGEIYDVDEKKMKFLDYFEDHPDMYRRTLISVEHKSSVKTQPNVPDSHTGTPNSQENQPSTHSCTVAPNSQASQPSSRSECWCYFYNHDGSLSELPHMDNYDSKGNHGLEYDRSVDVEFDN